MNCEAKNNANEVPNNPNPKKAEVNKPTFFAPHLSTRFPKNPADNPRNKIANENANVV